jgi:hypothetical protein
MRPPLIAQIRHVRVGGCHPLQLAHQLLQPQWQAPPAVMAVRPQ